MEKPERTSTRKITSCSIVSCIEDLMVNILSRLPVKVLLRFKCVCKQWNMLISDPYFVSSHHAQATTQDPNITKVLWAEQYDELISLCSIEEKEETIVNKDLILPNYPDSFILQVNRVILKGCPCNGLICLVGGRDTLVCNPATRNTMVIPGVSKRKCYVQGLGFSSSSNEFKVVRLFQRPELDTQWYGCELFTVCQRGTHGTNFLQHSRSWRHVGNLPHQIFIPKFRSMCYVNGSVHWMIFPVKLGNSLPSEFILSLDLELEEFKVVSRPEHWEKDARYEFEVQLKELEGMLCVVAKVIGRQLWDIWVLKDYTNSVWGIEYHINLEDIPRCNINYTISVVAICRGQLLLAVNNAVLWCYDLRTNFLEKVIDAELFFGYEGVGTYVESLVIPF